MDTTGHCLVTNNYYTSPSLAHLLYQKGHTILGTWKNNMGLPKDFKLESSASQKKIKELTSKPPKAIIVDKIFHDNKSIRVDMECIGVSFYCKKPITMLFTEKLDIFNKVLGGTQGVLKFPCQHTFNGMRGIDNLNREMANWSSYFRSTKY